MPSLRLTNKKPPEGGLCILDLRFQAASIALLPRRHASEVVIYGDWLD
jgi:hypothetical protein